MFDDVKWSKAKNHLSVIFLILFCLSEFFEKESTVGYFCKVNQRKKLHTPNTFNLVLGG